MNELLGSWFQSHVVPPSSHTWYLKLWKEWERHHQLVDKEQTRKFLNKNTPRSLEIVLSGSLGTLSLFRKSDAFYGNPSAPPLHRIMEIWKKCGHCSRICDEQIQFLLIFWQDFYFSSPFPLSSPHMHSNPLYLTKTAECLLRTFKIPNQHRANHLPLPTVPSLWVQ